MVTNKRVIRLDVDQVLTGRICSTRGPGGPPSRRGHASGAYGECPTDDAARAAMLFPLIRDLKNPYKTIGNQ